MRIFDFHVHVYPDNIAEKAVDSVTHYYGISVDNKGTVDAALKAGREAGVTDYLIHSVANLPKSVRAVNSFIAEQCQLHPEFHGFGTIHPDMDKSQIKEELCRIEELGLKGIKLHPDTQMFNMDSDNAIELYHMIEGKLPVLVHCGDYRFDFSHPKRLANVIDQCPELTVIGAHFGGWSLFDLAVEYLEHRKCYLDLSSSIPFIGMRRARELIDIYGADRILFGTDFPMWSPKEAIENVKNLGLAEEDLEKIMYKNALKILGETDE